MRITAGLKDLPYIGVQVMVQCNGIELIGFEAKSLYGSRTGNSAIVTAAESHDRPVALRYDPVQCAIGLEFIGKIDYFIFLNIGGRCVGILAERRQEGFDTRLGAIGFAIIQRFLIDIINFSGLAGSWKGQHRDIFVEVIPFLF